MPCRTPVEYVKKAIESLWRQTFKDFELLVIDDDAPKETREYLGSIKDSRLRIIHHEKAQGLCKSLNEGLHELKTDIIMRMDADDVAHPERFKKQLIFLQKNPEVAAVGTQIQFVDQQGKHLKIRNKVPLTHERIAYQLLWSNAMNHPTVAMRRRAVLEAGGYGSTKCEDYDLWTRLAARQKLANLPEKLLDYRVHQAQYTAAQKDSSSFTQDVMDTRIKYRMAVTGLQPEACDERANKTKEWTDRLAFYERLGELFPSFRTRQNLARRLYAEIASKQETGLYPFIEGTDLVRKLNWWVAFWKKLS